MHTQIVGKNLLECRHVEDQKGDWIIVLKRNITGLLTNYVLISTPHKAGMACENSR